MEKSRKMKDIALKEVSLVDKPANKRSFLLFKQDGKSESQDDSLLKAKKKINIEIDSDGTKKGTKIKVNGDTIANMKSFNFSIWSESLDDSSVSCSYSKLVESEGGFQRTESYYLAKGDSPMDERIVEILKKLFGEKITKFEKVELNEETIVEIVKALTIIEEYKDEFPTDLGSAIGLLALHAGQGYKQPELVEKAGAKLSKDTLTKMKALVAAAKALEALLPKEAGDDDVNKKAEDEKASQLQKTVETLAKSVSDITGKMEKKEASEQLEKINGVLSEVSNRLKVLEGKPVSTKKSLEETNSTPAKKEVQKDDQGRTIGHWPSLVGESDEEEQD